MQENFVRKLDQQIEKTEEDKEVQEKCREDQREQDEGLAERMNMAGNYKAVNKKTKAGRGAIVASGIGSYFGEEIISSYASQMEKRESSTFDSQGMLFGSNMAIMQPPKKKS